MPIPIMSIPDNDREDKPNTTMDYSFLFEHPITAKKKVIASNRDAELLFDLWSKGIKGDYQDSIKVDLSVISSSDIMRLKTKGFVTGGSDEIKFTSRGKVVISTMALGENSKFDDKKEEKSYTEILAHNSKRGKAGFRTPKFASNTSNNLNISKI